MPFAGAVSKIPGLYVAAAVWITHAAGVARLVADIVAGRELCGGDEVLKNVFDPTRFEFEDGKVLQERALATYNNIYNNDK
jgi:glycine/D-amino acid oxidase-like deaminating enzyme